MIQTMVFRACSQLTFMYFISRYPNMLIAVWLKTNNFPFYMSEMSPTDVFRKFMSMGSIANLKKMPTKFSHFFTKDKPVQVAQGIDASLAQSDERLASIMVRSGSSRSEGSKVIKNTGINFASVYPIALLMKFLP